MNWYKQTSQENDRKSDQKLDIQELETEELSNKEPDIQEPDIQGLDNQELIEPDYGSLDGTKVTDGDGNPKIVYHGTHGPWFKEFKPASWFSENQNEAGAYAYPKEYSLREKLLQQFQVGSSNGEYEGQYLPYAGILEDLSPYKIGQAYATDDDLVFVYLGKGRFKVLDDLEVDYGDHMFDSDIEDLRIKVRATSSPEKAHIFVKNHQDEVKQYYPKGEGGRVYPVYLDIRNPIELPPMEANRIAERMGKSREEIQEIINQYISQGYDGIATTSDEAHFWNIRELMNEDGTAPKQYLPFFPQQIKSKFSATDLAKIIKTSSYLRTIFKLC